MAMSSTAIVIKMVAERLELESTMARHFGLFRIWAVVPLLALILVALVRSPRFAGLLGGAGIKAVLLACC